MVFSIRFIFRNILRAEKERGSNSEISDSLINSHDDVGDDVGDVDDAVITLAGAGCINMRTKRLATCLHVHAGDHDDNHGYEL